LAATPDQSSAESDVSQLGNKAAIAPCRLAYSRTVADTPEASIPESRRHRVGALVQVQYVYTAGNPKTCGLKKHAAISYKSKTAAASDTL